MAVRDMPLAFVRGCARMACMILSSSVFGGAAADFLEPGILAMQEHVQEGGIKFNSARPLWKDRLHQEFFGACLGGEL